MFSCIFFLHSLNAWKNYVPDQSKTQICAKAVNDGLAS